MSLTLIVQLCGLAHIALGLGSIAIPKMLNWKEAFVHSPVLIKQMFWTYAGYILAINLFFGIVSLFLTNELLAGSGLAFALNTLIALYWIARLIIQFTYFDKTGVPTGGIYLVGEWALVLLFIVFSGVYSYTAYLTAAQWL